MKMPTAIEILFDSSRGQYLPKAFGEDCQHWSGVTQEEFRILRKGPANVHYWDVWNDVLNNAYYIEEASGRKFQLHHDGDLFAYCEAEMTEEQKENLFSE